MIFNRKTQPIILGMLLHIFVSSSSAHAQAIDEMINEVVAPVTTPFVKFIFSPLPGTDIPWIVLWLIIAATIFTFYFGFI